MPSHPHNPFRLNTSELCELYGYEASGAYAIHAPMHYWAVCVHALQHLRALRALSPALQRPHTHLQDPQKLAQTQPEPRL